MTTGTAPTAAARRTRRAHLLAGAGAVVLLVGVPSAGAAPVRVEDGHAVAGYVEQVRADLDLPHVSVMVSDRDRPVLERSFGDGRRLGPADQVLVGSVAKSMTATLVLQQVDRGHLALEQSVESVLAWSDLADVTVEELLTHTSGFTAADGLAVSDRGERGPEALGRAARDLERSAEVGEYRYSSANYLLLGAVLEAVTDRRYADVLRTDLLEPLGMTSTTALAAEADLVAGHRWWFGRPFPTDGVLDESGSPYGYVASTPGDLQVYAAAQAGARPDVLDAELLATLHEPRVEADDDGYGFGWRVKGDGASRLVHHTGASPGYFAHVVVRPSDGRTVVVVADAYGEAQAPALASTAIDVLTLLDGGDATATPVDRTLATIPWLVASAAGLGVLLAVRALHRPRRRATRWMVASTAFAVVVGAWSAPGLWGGDLTVLRTWAPDLAWSLVAVVLTWTTAGALLLVRRPTAGERSARRRERHEVVEG